MADQRWIQELAHRRTQPEPKREEPAQKRTRPHRQVKAKRGWNWIRPRGRRKKYPVA